MDEDEEEAEDDNNDQHVKDNEHKDEYMVRMRLSMMMRTRMCQ